MTVLVATEQHGGKWHKMSWETLAAGQQIAASLDAELSVLVAGSGVGALADELAGQQVNRVLAAEHDLLGAYSPDGYTRALEQVIEKTSPRLVLFPHTYFVRDYGPKLATRLNRPFLSDAVGVRVEEGRVIFVRQLFQGKMSADVTLSGDPPYFASIQSGAFRGDALETADSPAPIENVEISLDSRNHPHAPRRMVPRVEGRSRPFLGRHHRLGRPRHQRPRKHPDR